MSDPKAAAPKAPIPVQLDDGTVGTVAPEEFEQARQAGAQEVSPEVLRQAELQAKYGTTGGEALALGAGAARGLTFGLSDLAATELDPSLREDLAGLKEANPTASTVGEVGGAIAPLLLTDGAAAAGEGLSIGGAVRGLGALPRGVSALGGLAERGAAALVGEGATGIAGRALQRGIAMGARGAVEGAAFGMGNTISESALGDADITAEKLMAGAKGGALSGLLLGGGLGAVEGAGSAMFGKLRSRLDAAREAKAEAAPALAEPNAGSPYRAMGEHADEAASSVVPERATSVVETYANRFENAEELSNAWKNREKLFAHHDDTLEQATRSISDDLTKAVKAENAVDMASFGESKAKQMAKLVPDNDMALRVSQRETAVDMGQKLKTLLSELKEANGGGSPTAVNDLTKTVALFEKRADAAAKGSDIFMYLDDLKRAVGKKARAGERRFGLTEAEEKFREFYEKEMIPALQDQSVWGAAGAAQEEINKAASARFATRGTMATNFFADYDKTGFARNEVADPAKVEAFVKNLTSARNDLRHQSLNDYIQRERSFLDAVEKHYSLTSAEKAQVAEARRAFASAQKSIQKTTAEVSQVNAAKRLMEEEKHAAIGGLSGAVIDTITRPMTTLARLSEIEQSVKRVEKQITRGIGVFFKKTPEAVPIGAAKPLRDTYAKKVAEVADLSANPQKIVDSMAGRLGDLADHAPTVSASASALQARIVGFLASKIPAGQQPTDVLQPHLAKPRVSDQEMARFMRYSRAAEQPLTLVSDLENGRVTREAVEAVKTLYPSIYDSIRQRVGEELATAKTVVPYQKQLALGILFDVQTHPSLDPAFIAAMQQTWKPQQGGQGGGGMPPGRPLNVSKTSGAMQSPGERIEGR